MMRCFLKPIAALALALGIVVPLAYAADTTTPNLLLTNQESGGNLNTWGDIADANFERIDDKLGDTTTVSTTGGTTDLSNTQELVQIIKVTGTLVSNATLEFSCRGGYWLISNETSGDFTVTANCNGTTGTAISQGSKLGVYSDGSDIRAVGASGTKAVGEIFDYAGSTCPAQSIKPYGQAISRTTYSSLFGVVSTTYGIGDGSTTFNVPDLRGRVVAGEDDMGGTSANRLTNQSGGLNGDTLGTTGGAETHTLTTAELASHSHGDGTLGVASHSHDDGSYAISTAINDGSSVMRGNINFTTNNANQGGGGGFSYVTGGSPATLSNLSLNDGNVVGSSGPTAPDVTGSTASAGSGSAHNNVQPTIVLTKCLYTGV